MGLFLTVESRYHTDAFVVLVAVEHFFAEAEPRLRGDVVILEDDALVGERKGPLLREEVGGVAAAVLRLVVAVHLAGPIHILHDLPACLYACNITLPARPILIEEEARRLRPSHFGPKAFEVVGAIKEKD